MQFRVALARWRSISFSSQYADANGKRINIRIYNTKSFKSFKCCIKVHPTVSILHTTRWFSIHKKNICVVPTRLGPDQRRHGQIQKTSPAQVTYGRSEMTKFIPPRSVDISIDYIGRLYNCFLKDVPVLLWCFDLFLFLHHININDFIYSGKMSSKHLIAWWTWRNL